MPHSSGSGLNAPGGCLSKPTTSAVSALPAVSIACAVISAEPPVAQPFLTLMNGTPVSPSTDTVVSALPAASEPPAAKSICSQPRPASVSAARAACAAISRPDTPGWRPNGWMPRPMTATSSLMTRGRKAKVAVGDQRQLHRHADLELRGVGLGQARLDAHLARQLDVADAVGLELLRARVGRGLRAEALDRPAPERAAAGEPALLDVRRRAARAGALAREAHGAAARGTPSRAAPARSACRRAAQRACVRVGKLIAGERPTM